MDITMRLTRSVPALAGPLLVAAALLLAQPAPAAAQSARVSYDRAQTQEKAARASASADSLRRAARAYENLVRRYPVSGYSDNALWQAAGLMAAAYERTGLAADRSAAEDYLDWLTKEYPHSSLVAQVSGRRRALASPNVPPAAPAPPATDRASRPEPASPAGLAVVRRITHSPLPRGDRITIELSREVAYRGERVDAPDRVFFDLTASAPDGSLQADGIRGRLVNGLRLGTPESRVTRVVLDLTGTPRYSAYPLYDPFRLVIDLESDSIPVEAVPLDIARVPEPPPMPTPVAPAATTKGDYSLARQLGLGVSRIVIDAGHGGHDPGAQANGVVEADLVLDIARRLEKLLTARPGFQVVLTRSTDQFIPLEERTAIANREGPADLFLSIHANASRRVATRGVETYVLNFATNPEAEAVAARENASSSQTMGTLPAILNAIALNNKLDESRELATIVQTNLVRRLRALDPAVKDLGVKQAPFVVLIGAEMPSILAEIAFLTNKADAALLKRDDYRDRIAQALADAVITYQASLKKVTTGADRNEAPRHP